MAPNANAGVASFGAVVEPNENAGFAGSLGAFFSSGVEEADPNAVGGLLTVACAPNEKDGFASLPAAAGTGVGLLSVGFEALAPVVRKLGSEDFTGGVAMSLEPKLNDGLGASRAGLSARADNELTVLAVAAFFSRGSSASSDDVRFWAEEPEDVAPKVNPVVDGSVGFTAEPKVKPPGAVVGFSLCAVLPNEKLGLVAFTGASMAGFWAAPKVKPAAGASVEAVSLALPPNVKPPDVEEEEADASPSFFATPNVNPDGAAGLSTFSPPKVTPDGVVDVFVEASPPNAKLAGVACAGLDAASPAVEDTPNVKPDELLKAAGASLFTADAFAPGWSASQHGHFSWVTLLSTAQLGHLQLSAATTMKRASGFEVFCADSATVAAGWLEAGFAISQHGHLMCFSSLRTAHDGHLQLPSACLMKRASGFEVSDDGIGFAAATFSALAGADATFGGTDLVNDSGRTLGDAGMKANAAADDAEVDFISDDRTGGSRSFGGGVKKY